MKRKKIILLLLLIIPMLLIKNVLAQDTVYTRKQLQEMVVSTALSYYYNTDFSDFEQRSMLSGTDYVQDVGYFNWRNFNNSPEMVSRSNYYNIDCFSFTAVSNLYSIGYDFSDYYNDIKNISFYTYDTSSKKIVKKSTHDSKETFQQSYLNIGTGENGGYFEGALKNNYTSSEQPNSDTSSDIVYYYEVSRKETIEYDDENNYTIPAGAKCNTATYNETCEKQEEIKNTILNLLQPGDILLSRRIKYNGKDKDTNEPKYLSSGHAVMYVGDALKKGEHGFIQSVGTDGKQDSSIRYVTWESYIESILFLDDQRESTMFAIIRPTNKYCTSDTNCHINNSTIESVKYKNNSSLYINNTIARNELSNLRLEQYEFKNGEESKANLSKDILNKYNSVNVGDKINYRLLALNRSKFDYCTQGNYTTKTTCEEKGYKWQSTDRDLYTYSNFVVTAKIPDGTKYVEGSCYYGIHTSSGLQKKTTCQYDANTKTVRWNVADTIGVDRTAYTTWNYQVEVVSSKINKVVNEGMVIEDAVIKNVSSNTQKHLSNKLKFGELTTNVNKTINSPKEVAYFQKVVKDIVKSNKKYDEKINFVADVYKTFYEKDIDALKHPNELIKSVYSSVSEVDSNLLGYFRRMDYSNTSDINKTINNLMVPSLYGGRHLLNNLANDRPGIVYKTANKSTLEVGDIIIGLDSKSKYKLDNYHVLLFYGFDSSDHPILVEYDNNKYLTYTDSKDIKSDAILGSSVQSIGGFDKLISMYEYDLFYVLRPSRTGLTPVVKEDPTPANNKPSTNPKTGLNNNTIIVLSIISSALVVYVIVNKKYKIFYK